MTNATPTMFRWEPPSKHQAESIGAYLSRGVSAENQDGRRNQLTHWKLGCNPANSGMAHVFCSNKDENDINLVSTFTVTPKNVWAWESEALWAEVGDTVTIPEFQRKGLFSKLHDSITASALDAGVKVMFGLPNQSSFPGYVRKLKWRVKENANLITATRLNGSTRFADMIADRLGNNRGAKVLQKIVKNPFFDRPLHFLITNWTKLQRSGDVQIEIVSEIPDEMTDLWRTVRSKVSICVIRDKEALNWRFIENPLSFKVFVARRNGKSVGYMVTHFERNAGSEFGRLSIADWLYDPSLGVEVGAALLRRALLEEDNAGVEVVSAWATTSSPFPLPWKRFGFVVRNAPKPFIIYPNDDGEKVVLDGGQWHFTLSDTDPF